MRNKYIVGRTYKFTPKCDFDLIKIGQVRIFRITKICDDKAYAEIISDDSKRYKSGEEMYFTRDSATGMESLPYDDNLI